MGKYDSFNKLSNPSDDFKKVLVEGTYGCQECPMFVTHAYFNEDEGTMTWTCKDGHESRISVGV